ncbi:CHAT domain-containing protein [Cyathus striatus]|nr:CHAT domain-containing protein [Cyathus striatus]
MHLQGLSLDSLDSDLLEGESDTQQRAFSIVALVNWTTCLAIFSLHHVNNDTYGYDGSSRCKGTNLRPLSYIDISKESLRLQLEHNGVSFPTRLWYSLDDTTPMAERSEVELKPQLMLDILSLHIPCNENPVYNHVSYWTYLHARGLALLLRYECTKNIADINASISALEAVISSAPNEDPERARWLNNIGNAYRDRYTHLSNPKDIESAIISLRESISLTDEHEEDMPRRLNNLGNCLVDRFELMEDSKDIEEAIMAQRRAVKLTPDSDKAFPIRYDNKLETIDDAIEILQSAHVQDAHYAKPYLLNTLSNCFLLRHGRTGSIDDLKNMTSALEDAKRLTPSDSPLMASLLSNLGSCYRNLFEETNDSTYLDNAISSQREAMPFVPLGTAFYYRFEYTGALTVHLTIEQHTGMFQLLRQVTDLDEAIELFRKGIDVLSSGHPSLIGALNNLGIALYEKNKDGVDLDESISVIQQAIELLHDKPELRALYLNNLGNVLLTKAENSSDPAGVKDAIEYLTKAVKFTPDGHAMLPSRLTTLGNALVALYVKYGDMHDLKHAIELHKKALKLTPDNHAELTSRLNNLGNTFIKVWKDSGNDDDLKSASEFFEKAAMNLSGPPHLRLLTARMWGFSCSRIDPRRSLSGYAVALSLLPEIAWIGDPVSDRHLLLATVPNLVSDAVSTAIKFGLNTLAVEWFEQGRSILWGQLNQLRTPLDQLREVNPEIAESIEKVSRALRHAGLRDAGTEIFGAGTIQRINSEREAREHHRLAEEWQELIEKDFLLSPDFKDISTGLPSSGFVLRYILQPLTFHLDAFSYEKAKAIHRSLDASLVNAGIKTRQVRAGRPVLEKVLIDLWINQLRKLPMLPKGKLSVWWCLSGPLSFLPLHAAGIYGMGQKHECLMDIVISSYIPSLSAIMVARPTKEQFRPPSGILVVGNAHAPGLPAIPSVQSEAQEIQQICKENGVPMEAVLNESATPETVVYKMKDYSWIHLACHASQDLEKPMRSAFHLHDGNLTLFQLLNEAICPRAEFAFLSACQTAAESVHLASAMISAGYRSVIATIWPIFDDDAPLVANDVYNSLVANGASPMEALHDAVAAMRIVTVPKDLIISFNSHW